MKLLYLKYTHGVYRPYGKLAIIRTFGAVSEMAQGKHLKYVELNRPIRLAWDEDVLVHRFLAHEKLKDLFEHIFNVELGELTDEEWFSTIKDFGGCWNVRAKKGTSAKYSTHSWGIAIDLNVKDNPLGGKPNQPQVLVDVFKKYGFIWGGDWKHRPDPMHFQFASGY